MPDESNEYGIIGWIAGNAIKNEKGDLINFDEHPFLYEIYDDEADDLVVMKAAQVGMSTCEILRNHYAARNLKMDIIYTLPTESDVNVFVQGKVNRIIANNQCMLEDVADKDSVESKKVGQSMIYFRGTFTKKAAIMITADRLAHDEMDSSKLDVIADYQSRLQHSKFKQTHVFSHPDLPDTGVHTWWKRSDQKHWFITCPHCSKRQYLSWDINNPKRMSVDLERREFVCKECRGVLTNDDRISGEWVAKYPDKKVSGYWVPMLIAPWVSAGELVDKYHDKDTTPWFWATRVLGLPYADGASKLLKKHFTQNITGKLWTPTVDERVVIGVDTGLKIDYVMGNKKGLFYAAEAKDYGDLDGHMKRWPKAIAVVDAGGDLIGSRKFKERWPGRVFLCYTGGDRKSETLVKWGKKDETGTVIADRNGMIQLVVDEFRDARLPVHGEEDDWYEYYGDWANLSRIKVLDPDTNVVKGHKWVRSGRDHKAMATVYWRVGLSRFGSTGSIVEAQTERKPNSYMVETDKTVKFNPDEFFDRKEEIEEDDWRN